MKSILGQISRVGLAVCVTVLLLSLAVRAEAEVVEYNLTISEQEVNFTGKSVRGMTINGGIPGPALRFSEGDTARISVRNDMRVDTSIHWHGLLVPPGMDGVPYVSFPPIAPGTTFTYEFPIRQSGTYWYHSHTSLQEQRGIYGAIVIEPSQERFNVDREYVVLLSDWTDEDPYEVQRTLRRGSELYALQKGSGQSIFGAAKLGMLGEYLKRELIRMPPMDISDVAYDYFLANGKPDIMMPANPGETVRLRIIDGSATTYFHLEFAGGPMEIVAADGVDVEPLQKKRFLIAVAETYDVTIRMPSAGAYEFRATAHDGSGYASVWIGDGEKHFAPNVPRPNMYQLHAMDVSMLKRIFALTPAGAMGMPQKDVDAGKFDKPGMAHMGHDGMSGMHSMEGAREGGHTMEHEAGVSGERASQAQGAATGMVHAGDMADAHSMESRNGKRFGRNFRPLAADASSARNLAVDGSEEHRPWTPYKGLRATKKTAPDVDKPVREIRLTLDGDMERYVWLLNNKTLSESDSIRIRKGEIVRFIMINRTMMHHPMHLHGHFFRVINDQGEYSPLKHTVNVAPMSTTVIEFDANEFGDWFFHCHLLYHMKSGMARVVEYDGYDPGPEVAAIRPTLFKDAWYAWAEADALSNMTQGMLSVSNTRNIVTAEWEVGWNRVEETEWEGILVWDRYMNRFLTFFAGADFLGEDDGLEEARGIFGVGYLLPLNIETRLWVDTDGGGRFEFEKDFELTPRLTAFGGGEYDTHDLWEGRAGLTYAIHKNISLIGQWHSEFGWGGGLRILF